jgi:predicted Zn-dependent peptidase
MYSVGGGPAWPGCCSRAADAARPGDPSSAGHVILAPDAATAVAVNLWYDVGSRHERPGRSGFGHLFEHLMFQGSENVQRGQHMQLVERAGGSLNASITEDRTNYFQTLPPDRYNLALWLESDRMRSLQITNENMRREIEVVKEERRLRIDNRRTAPRSSRRSTTQPTTRAPASPTGTR